MIAARLIFWIWISLLFLCGCGRPEYTSGEAVYEGECRKCHKLNGSGGEKGPELTDILIKQDTDYVRKYTIDPRSMKADGTMPPSKLTERELELLIQYLVRQTKDSQ